jgi:hypothetical protein
MKIFGKHAQVPELSELDQFICEFNAQRSGEPDCRAVEKSKHEDLAKKRDQKMTPKDTQLWEGF